MTSFACSSGCADMLSGIDNMWSSWSPERDQERRIVEQRLEKQVAISN